MIARTRYVVIFGGEVLERWRWYVVALVAGLMLVGAGMLLEVEQAGRRLCFRRSSRRSHLLQCPPPGRSHLAVAFCLGVQA